MLLLTAGCGEAGRTRIEAPLPEQPRIGAVEGTGSVEESPGPRDDLEPMLSLASVCFEVCRALAVCGVGNDCIDGCLAAPIMQTPECLTLLRDLDLCFARVCFDGPDAQERCLTPENVERLDRCRVFR